MKNVQATFKTQKVIRIAYELKHAESKLHVVILADNGLTKRFKIDTMESEILQANVDKGAYPTTVVAETGELSRLAWRRLLSLQHLRARPCRPTGSMPAACRALWTP